MRRNKVYTYYNEHAKTCSPEDFWGQVKRSVNGRVVDEDQIRMIVAAIHAGLQLESSDVVLDLCCGNGVLSDLVFERCAGGLGIDFAEYLIGVAKQHFERPGSREYRLADVLDFVQSPSGSEHFTKLLCYSSFQYFSPESGRLMLQAIRDRLPAVSRVFFGNMPDKARLHDFYYRDSYVAGVENDYESAIGLWRTEDEFAALASDCGWNVTYTRMPKAFYAAHYRFDAALTRKTD